MVLTWVFMLGCASHPVPFKVASIDDVPDITQTYKSQIDKLKVGMSKGQVIALFPYAERECFPSGVCNITVFREDLIQIDVRLADLNKLTGTLISLLALTCILSDDDCTKAAVAALNVGLASAVESNLIENTHSNTGVVSLLQWINIEVSSDKVTQWAINKPLSQFQPKNKKLQRPTLEEAMGITTKP